MINYFCYKKINDKFLITNDLGRYLFVSPTELKQLIKDKVNYESDFGKKSVENFFCYNGSLQSFTEQLKPYYRESKNYLFQSTGLHIFVLTNACNLRCIYCQAHCDGSVSAHNMSKETAKKAVDIAFTSPCNSITIEFQGGEPLINLETLKYIVEYSTELSEKTNKKVEYNLVSNLTLLTEEIALFLKENNVGISTSLDGTREMHDKNRIYVDNRGTFYDVVEKIKLLESCGIGYGAIQTTTKDNLNKSKELIDAYVSLGLQSVFVRNLTPLGCAYSSWEQIGYTPEEFIEFYRKCFNYILELNKSGVILKEGHASIMLSKIMAGYPINYMELRSPCGAGIGQIAYYYDGNIYTCDEGRMLAEMGDESFKLGSVDNTYDELMNSNNCKAACVSSFIESLPNCCDCVYNCYCGTCPVINVALSKNVYNREPNDYKCKIYKGIFDTIFEALQDNENKALLKKWL